ncbi:MAG: hypothetical protein N4Q18_11085, partial [Lactobacillus crispatus]|nr:hypothetical protein [Lactobacillus crispatus]
MTKYNKKALASVITVATLFGSAAFATPMVTVAVAEEAGSSNNTNNTNNSSNTNDANDAASYSEWVKNTAEKSLGKSKYDVTKWSSIDQAFRSTYGFSKETLDDDTNLPNEHHSKYFLQLRERMLNAYPNARNEASEFQKRVGDLRKIFEVSKNSLDEAKIEELESARDNLMNEYSSISDNPSLTNNLPSSVASLRFLYTAVRYGLQYGADVSEPIYTDDMKNVDALKTETESANRIDTLAKRFSRISDFLKDDGAFLVPKEEENAIFRLKDQIGKLGDDSAKKNSPDALRLRSKLFELQLKSLEKYTLPEILDLPDRALVNAMQQDILSEKYLVKCKFIDIATKNKIKEELKKGKSFNAISKELNTWNKQYHDYYNSYIRDMSKGNSVKYEELPMSEYDVADSIERNLKEVRHDYDLREFIGDLLSSGADIKEVLHTERKNCVILENKLKDNQLYKDYHDAQNKVKEILMRVDGGQYYHSTFDEDLKAAQKRLNEAEEKYDNDKEIASLEKDIQDSKDHISIMDKLQHVRDSMSEGKTLAQVIKEYEAENDKLRDLYSHYRY